MSGNRTNQQLTICVQRLKGKNGHTVAVVRASPKLTEYRSSSIEGRLPSKVVFHRRSSSIEGPLPSKVVFRPRSSSVKGRLPSKVVFHQKLSSVKGRHPPKVVHHQRWSSIKLYVGTVPTLCIYM